MSEVDKKEVVPAPSKPKVKQPKVCAGGSITVVNKAGEEFQVSKGYYTANKHKLELV